MKALLLDGSHAGDATGARVSATLMGQLQSQGWDVTHIVLRDKKIGPCAGDFFCWIRTPGVCIMDDDNRTVAAEIAASDLLVYLTPVTFGGYASPLKGMVDHQIQNLSPFFAKIEGETHHHKRYASYPDMLGVGWMDAPDAPSEAVFRHLFRRNAINFHATTAVSGVVFADQTDEALQAAAQTWLDDLRKGQSSPPVALPASVPTGGGEAEIRRAVLLVGSPRTSKSTSAALGEYLFEQLRTRSVKTETLYTHTAVRSPEKLQALLDAVDAADLVTLAFPLYVDSLPASAVEVLERIAAYRRGRDPFHRPMFTAIVNNGFPEVAQNETAAAICAIFAQQAGLKWAGSLMLGGGGMVNGVPLVKGGGKTVPLRQSLALAAEALAQGKSIPQTAQGVLSRYTVPGWAYRLMSGLGWVFMARGYHAVKLLRRRPYAAERTARGASVYED